MEITLYSAFWCPDCRVAKRFLAKHNIRYKEIDIATTPGAADEVVRRTGKRGHPATGRRWPMVPTLLSR